MSYPIAENLTSSAGLAHLATVLYRKRGLDRLEKKFVFRKACKPDMLERSSGRTVQYYRYNNLAAKVTPTTEGTNSAASILPVSHILQATVSQYSAFINVSDLLEATAIDPIVQNHAALLGYAAGLTLDTITRNVIDAESAGTNQALQATYLRVSDLRASRHNLQALDVMPFEDGEFKAYVHPYASYDLVNDPAAMGLADIFKYNTNVKETPLVKYEDRGFVTSVGGCRVEETTNTATGTSGGNNTYRAYVFGDGGVGTVDLSGKAPSAVTDPKKQRFKINVIQGEPSVVDPEGLIGAVVSYNFVTNTSILQGPAGIGGPYRYKTLDPQSTIA